MLEAYRDTTKSAQPATRTDLVRMEGCDAARRGLPPHVNPYRSKSADGVAWRQGYDRALD